MTRNQAKIYDKARADYIHAEAILHANPGLDQSTYDRDNAAFVRACGAVNKAFAIRPETPPEAASYVRLAMTSEEKLRVIDLNIIPHFERAMEIIAGSILGASALAA